jgi:hypothetical protein
MYGMVWRTRGKIYHAGCEPKNSFRPWGGLWHMEKQNSVETRGMQHNKQEQKPLLHHRKT